MKKSLLSILLVAQSANAAMVLPAEKTTFKLILNETGQICPATVDTKGTEWENPARDSKKEKRQLLSLHSASVVFDTDKGYEQRKGEYIELRRGAFKIVYGNLIPTADSFKISMSCNYGGRNQISRIRDIPWGADTCTVNYSSRSEDAKVTIKCDAKPAGLSR